MPLGLAALLSLALRYVVCLPKRDLKGMLETSRGSSANALPKAIEQSLEEVMNAHVRVLGAGADAAAKARVNHQRDVLTREVRERRLCQNQTHANDWGLREIWHPESLHMEAINSLACMRTGDATLLVASASDDGTVVVQRAPEGATSAQDSPSIVGGLSSPDGSAVRTAALIHAHRDNDWLVAANGASSTAVVWSIADDGHSHLLYELGPQRATAESLDAAAGILASKADHVVEVWDLEAAGRRVQCLDCQEKGMVGEVKLPSSQLLALLCSGSPEEGGGWQVLLWDLRSRRPAHFVDINLNASMSHAAMFDAIACDEGYLLAASAGSAFSAWDLRRALRPLLSHDVGAATWPGAHATAIALDPCSTRLVALGVVRPGSSSEAVFVSELPYTHFHECHALQDAASALRWAPPAKSHALSDARIGESILVAAGADHSVRGFLAEKSPLA